MMVICLITFFAYVINRAICTLMFYRLLFVSDICTIKSIVFDGPFKQATNTSGLINFL